MHTTHKINLPLVAFASCLGVSSTMHLPVAPILWCYTVFALVAVAAIFLPNKILRLTLCVLAGYAYMCLHINWHYTKLLPLELEKQKITIVGTVIGLPVCIDQKNVKFSFEVENVQEHTDTWLLPSVVQLTWQQPDISVEAGQKLQLVTKLKRPRNFANPGSFDLEKFMFQQRIVGLGYVLNNFDNMLLAHNPANRWLNQLRQHILLLVQRKLQHKEYIGVILALGLGIKRFIPPAQNLLYQNTGVAHLMAISGMHIGLLAAIVFSLVKFIWLFGPARLATFSLPVTAATAAFIVALAYSAITGMAISTQRSLIMIACCLLAVVCKRKTASSYRFSLALILVLICDPFVVLAPGFWLSFIAVASLIFTYGGRPHLLSKFKLWFWLKPQLVIFIAMLPISLLIFAQVSLVSPLSNIIAIPWVSILVVPLSIFGIFACTIDEDIGLYLLQKAESVFGIIVPLLKYFDNLPVFKWHPPLHFISLVIICAVVAVVWLCLPKGLPGRMWAVVGLMPMLFAKINSLPMSNAHITVLDVGQGLSVVVRTQHHTLVYDTGAKLSPTFDLGSRVVSPYLINQGITSIDKLMISHVDNDHIGGAQGLIDNINVQEILLNDALYLPAYAHSTCLAGQHWIWDGVEFEILHPQANFYSKQRNDQSCVLMITANKQKILLTGDIGIKSEYDLIERYGSRLQADILLVPHHGSKTSSSEKFIYAVRPKLALIPAGYKNQYGHPKPEVMQRYAESNVQIQNTAYDGAIIFILGATDSSEIPHLSLYRREQHGFWLAKDPQISVK